MRSIVQGSIVALVIVFFSSICNSKALRGQTESKSLKLACYYFDQVDNSSRVSFLNPGLPMIWAKGPDEENIYLEGADDQGFFLVEKMTGKNDALFFGGGKISEFSSEMSLAKSFCEKALQLAYPSAYKNKVLLKLGAKSSFLSLRSLPPVFDTNNDRTESARVNRLVIFGDSMSDWGNLKNWVRLFPREPYFAGRFSDGPVWVDYFGKIAEVAIQNFAVGGAPTKLSDTGIKFGSLSEDIKRGGRELLTGSVETEISRYYDLSLDQVSLNNDQNTMFFIWAGGNDYLYRLDNPYEANVFLDQPFEPQLGYMNFVQTVTSNLISSMERLYQLGARHFMVANLPNLGLLPKMANNSAYYAPGLEPLARTIKISRLIHDVTLFHNNILAEKVQHFSELHPDASAKYVDMYAAVLSVEQNQAIGGTEFFDYELVQEAFTRKLSEDGDELNLGVACYKGSSFRTERDKICPAPRRMMFWDEVHPTSFSHGLLGFAVHRSSELFKHVGIETYLDIAR